MLELPVVVLERVERFALLVEQKSVLEGKISAARLANNQHLVKTYQVQLDGVNRGLDAARARLDSCQYACC
jgi:hypothetical protein